MICSAFVISVLGAGCGAAQTLAPPPPGKLYHGCYWGGVGTDTHDPTEHDVEPTDVQRYEQAVGRRAAWIYFSDNWFESRKFPVDTCTWIRAAGKVPYIRLMLRSDVDQKHPDQKFSLARIVRGDFDSDLRQWADEAKQFGSPILIEWGTEPNGDWFGWSARWNGGSSEGPARFVAAYRHVVDMMRSEGAPNVAWVWHVNWLDEPERRWNRMESYFPGNDYCDWIGLSAYGPTTPRMRDGTESFRFKIDHAYSRLTKLGPDKPIIISEFGCDIHNPHLSAATWARHALQDLFGNRWPAIVGFCWWNEGWQNDETKKHDSDLIILHDRALTNVFRDDLAKHGGKIQEEPIVR